MTDRKQIPYAPGYCVSTDGVVYSLKTGQAMSARSYGKMQYKQVGFYGPTGKKLLKLVHSVVLETFVGPRPPGMVCRHLDGNSQNNRLENLTWGTPAENNADRARHGTLPQGSDNGMAKLTEADVFQILTHRGWLSVYTMANTFGVDFTNIGHIWNGKTWLTALPVRPFQPPRRRNQRSAF